MLDVGDIIQIQLVGPNDYIEDFPINPDGSVSIPDVGKIVIAGFFKRCFADY